MPNMSNKRRPPVRIAQLNPFARAEKLRLSRAAKDAAFNAVWDSVEES